MSSFLRTALSDRIAFDRRGNGPGVIFVAGAGPWRAGDPGTTRTAELLAEKGYTTVVYDRVGRGESAAAAPITVDRELAAIAGLIDELGGSAILCGHSSGCSLSLLAAARGLPVTALALWEAPLGPPDSGAKEWADELRTVLANGDLLGALSLYMKDLPPEMLERAKSVPAMVDQAPSLQPDADSLAWAESAPLPQLLSGIRMPVLVMVGTSSYDEVMVPAAESIVAAIPGAEWKRVPGAQHTWEPASMAAELAQFASGAAR